jgi:RimJ/RimL family protein N-acetyltransferase
VRSLAAARLRLEPQVAAHAEEMFAVLSDPRIYEHENAPPRSLEWLRERFAKLESRRSPDGSEEWLNWTVRLPTGEAIGYVQATVRPPAAAIAYEFASAWWGKGLAREALESMISELAASYGVRELTAVLKRSNARSQRLLGRLGLGLAPPERAAALGIEDDEMLYAGFSPRPLHPLGVTPMVAP